MIRITGDTHGEHSRFIDNNMGDESWTEGDYLIICGDFGFIFRGNQAEQDFLDYLETKPYTICFCDGNHENFPAIFSYPREKWNGGDVHRIRKNVYHLMRGQVFSIDGKRIFVMGGGYSIDRYMRRPGVSYWHEELPCAEEYREAVKNLASNNNAVDLIITHSPPREIIRKMGDTPDPREAEFVGFLEWVMYEIDFGHWYFGHWHVDHEIDDKFTAVFFDVHKVE